MDEGDDISPFMKERKKSKHLGIKVASPTFAVPIRKVSRTGLGSYQMIHYDHDPIAMVVPNQRGQVPMPSLIAYQTPDFRKNGRP